MHTRVAVSLPLGILLLGACVLAPPALSPGVGALDIVLLSDESEEVGPVSFRHAEHYDLKAEGGREIHCALCHHDYTGDVNRPPGACRTCHMSHDAEEDEEDGADEAEDHHARVPYL